MTEEIIDIGPDEDIYDLARYPFTKPGQIFPIIISHDANQAPAGTSYNLYGFVQCTHYISASDFYADITVFPSEMETGIEKEMYRCQIGAFGNTEFVNVLASSSGGMTLVKEYTTPKQLEDPLELNGNNKVFVGDMILMIVQVSGSAMDGQYAIWCNLPARTTGITSTFLSVPTYSGGSIAMSDQESFSIGWTTTYNDYWIISRAGNAELSIYRIYKL